MGREPSAYGIIGSDDIISSRVSYYSGHLSVVVVRRPSTVARFLTAGPIDLKLGGWVPWPKRVGCFFHFSDLTLYMATRGCYPKTHFGHFQANGDS